MRGQAKTCSSAATGRRVGLARQLALALALTAAAVLLAPASAFAASATTDTPTLVRSSSATLNAHIDPAGDPGITSCHFEWGETIAYGNTAPCKEGNSFTSPADVSADIAGLTAGSTYHYRVVVLTTSSGTIEGLDQSFTTYHGPIASFGADGTSSTIFGANRALAFDQAARKLYVIGSDSELFGFSASVPPAYSPLAGFSPLATALTAKWIAVDNTALSSAGNVYYTTSKEESAVYGHSSTGLALPGFPLSAFDNGNFGAPTSGAGVDSLGHIWAVTTDERFRLKELSPAEGKLLRTVYPPGGEGFGPLAFNSADDLYGITSKGIQKLTVASDYEAGIVLIPKSTDSPVDLAVDSSNGLIYIAYEDKVVEYDASGVFIDEFATDIVGAQFRGIAVDSTNHYVYVSDSGNKVVRVYSSGALLPFIRIGAVSQLANTSATLNATVNPNGQALSDCHFEYVTEAAFLESGFNDLSSGGSAPCSPAFGSIPADSSDHAVSAAIGGLTKSTTYRYQLVAGGPDGSTSRDAVFTTPGPPSVETTGSPVRSASTARLEGRVNPLGSDATYHFEYGDLGSCDLNPCAATEPQYAGSGNEIKLVSQQLTGLEPGATYHYRLIADNGNAEGPAFGGDMTLTTYVSDAPLSHGDFPGPAGSDRAWELVSAPDSGGNPVTRATGISDDGNRATYGVAGGTPESTIGSLNNQLFAERTPSGWKSKAIFPTRAQNDDAGWLTPTGKDDLSALVGQIFDTGGGGSYAVWRLSPTGPAQEIFNVGAQEFAWSYSTAVSEDATRVITALKFGSFDPEHPVPPNTVNLYDISSGGTPRLINFLPDGGVPACGVEGARLQTSTSESTSRLPRVVSADGSLAFFPSRGDGPCGSFGAPVLLYVRDIEAESTKLISPPPLSGPQCDSDFIKSTQDAAFFLTRSRLVARDTAPESCANANVDADGVDVYRYDLGDGSLECVTCVVPGVNAAVIASELPLNEKIAIAEDGSRIYFTSANRLLPGAAPNRGTYRLNVASGDLAYLGHLDTFVGDKADNDNSLTPDGSVFAFRSKDPSLNAIGGQQNGGTSQYYRYDDNDRSLICVSCPADGSAPHGHIEGRLSKDQLGSNLGALDESGDRYVFNSPTALVPADQNTAGPGQPALAGTDVYEWRDGRVLLVSDGLTNWPAVGESTSAGPQVGGITPSGSDIFFTAAAQYTKDALDGYRRLYTARIGGGIEFPPPPKPCPLEVCQGTPKGAPEEAAPGTASILGAGNTRSTKPPARCAKGKRLVRKAGKTRCVSRKAKQRNQKANNRRAGR